MTLKIALAAAVASSSPCAAFLGLPNLPSPLSVAHPRTEINPALTGYLAERETSALLKITLDVGTHVEERGGVPVVAGNRLGVNGVLIELGGEDADRDRPSLPGADGPNSALSTGPRSLRLLSRGKFVDLSGARRVDMDHGVWEMVWRADADNGFLTCGFDIPEEVKRNEASIPQGRLYMTFPLWTEDSLRQVRERKEQTEMRVKEATDRLRESSRRMEEEMNPLKKALHFRDGLKAQEDIENSGYRMYSSMQLDGGMVDLGGGVRLGALGTVWTEKDGSPFGGDRVLLGSAAASAGDRGRSEETESAGGIGHVASEGLHA